VAWDTRRAGSLVLLLRGAGHWSCRQPHHPPPRRGNRRAKSLTTPPLLRHTPCSSITNYTSSKQTLCRNRTRDLTRPLLITTATTPHGRSGRPRPPSRLASRISRKDANLGEGGKSTRQQEMASQQGALSQRSGADEAEPKCGAVRTVVQAASRKPNTSPTGGRRGIQRELSPDHVRGAVRTTVWKRP